MNIDRLSKLFEKSERINIDESSKIIIMSDCHRGDGSGSDDFLKNRNIVYHALSFYFNAGFTYIELGDGDEMWKNRNFSHILSSHLDVFDLMNRFHSKGRLYIIYGNHDIVKKRPDWGSSNLSVKRARRQTKTLMGELSVHEGLVLSLNQEDRNILLLHGHQVDFLNYDIWPIARFLVRYLWKPLQMIGFKDPLSTSGSEERKGIVDNLLESWADREQQMLIAGHTHQYVFPGANDPLYINDGCCSHPEAITNVEISNGEISLVRWSVNTKSDGTLFVKRTILYGPSNINFLFDQRYE
jgi:UDP-2,3-diacylglucosamine pyrophosphatase LpxH